MSSYTFDAQVQFDSDNGTVAIYSHATGALLVAFTGLPKGFPDPRKSPMGFTQQSAPQIPETPFDGDLDPSIDAEHSASIEEAPKKITRKKRAK